jgi:hypothetical protein
MSTPATIAITPGAGQLLDAVSLVVSAQTVVRETMVIADPTNPTELAAVVSAALGVFLPTAQITTLTPPSATAIGTAVATDLLIGTQVAGSSVPVALPAATITALTPPTAAAIAAAIVANPPTITATISSTVGVTQSTSPWVVSLTSTTITGSVAVTGTFFQATQPVSGTITANQGISPWIVAGGGTAGTAATGVVTVQGIAAMTPLLVTASFATAQHIIVDSGTITAVTSITNPVAVTGTFFQATQPISIASAQVASGAFASGSIASGAIASGAIASGAIAAGAAAAGAFADGSVFVRSNAASTFPVTATIAAAQTIAVTQATAASLNATVVGTGTFVVQATLAAETTKVIGTVNQGTSPWVISGAVTTSGTATIIGTLTNNNAVPAATNVGVLPSIANAAVSTRIEGDQVLQSSDLQGSTRVRPGAPTTANWLQAAINTTSATAVLVAAVGGQTVRVMRMFFVNSDSTTVTNVTIQDTTPTSFSGAFRLITGGSFNGTDANGEPLYVSAVGKGIQLVNSAAVQLSGTIWYTQSA